MTESDDTLLRAIRAGDLDALAEVLQRHAMDIRSAVVGRIPRRWQSVLSVEDVLQQTYTDALLDIGDFVPVGDDAVVAWLKTLARHNLTDALRQLEAQKRGGTRRPTTAPNDESYASLSELLLADSATTPSQHAVRSEAIAALRGAVAALPDAHRLVVEWYDLGGREVNEVAAELERSPGAVYLLRNRAHKRLRALLGHGRGFSSHSA